MEAVTQLQPSYHMIIRLVDRRPILVLPRHNLSGSNNQHNSINVGLDNHQKVHDQPVACANSKNNRGLALRMEQIKAKVGKQLKNFNNDHQVASLLSGKLSPSKSEQIKMLKNDLVNSLNRITQERQADPTCQRKCHRLQQLQLIETCSMTESQSYDFDDNESEIMQLTQQQKQFFNNFIQQSAVNQCHFEAKHITALQLIPPVSMTSKEKSITQSDPANKSKVIRNFFRPKLIQNSNMKDEKTCISSHTFTDSQIKRSKLKQESPDKRQRCFGSYLFS